MFLQVLIRGLELHPRVVDLLPLPPNQLPTLIEMNHFLAVDLVPVLLEGSTADA
jgi:hypothetical protein